MVAPHHPGAPSRLHRSSTFAVICGQRGRCASIGNCAHGAEPLKAGCLVVTAGIALWTCLETETMVIKSVGKVQRLKRPRKKMSDEDRYTRIQMARSILREHGLRDSDLDRDLDETLERLKQAGKLNPEIFRRD
jgi:hypothetical protein